MKTACAWDKNVQIHDSLSIYSNYSIVATDTHIQTSVRVNEYASAFSLVALMPVTSLKTAKTLLLTDVGVVGATKLWHEWYG